MKFGFQKLCVAFAAVAALAGSANAADIYTKARPAPMVEMYNWTGFYVGGEIGYLSGDVVNNCPNGFCPARDVKSFVGGVQAGYNWQAPGSNWVLGLFVNAPILQANISDSPLLPAAFNAKIEWAIAGGARIGYAFDRFMPFVFGGVIAGEAAAQNNLLLPGVTEKHTHVGYTVGGGVEYAINRNWSSHIRYAYADLGAERYPVVYAPTDSFGFTAHNVTVGINYRFGGPVVAKY